MALATDKKEAAPVVAQKAPEFVLLELAFYKRYTRGVHGKTFEADNAYRFTKEQAEVLLQDVEEVSGRPIWRRYKPKADPRRVVVPEGHKATMDATDTQIAKMAMSDEVNIKGLEVGSDAEIADILAAVPEGAVEM